MVSMGLGQLGVDLSLENGHIGFKDKIVLHSLKEVKCHQGYTSDFCYLLFNLLGLPYPEFFPGYRYLKQLLALFQILFDWRGERKFEFLKDFLFSNRTELTSFTKNFC